jgi:carbon monoxide dehydrogenase subunit G
MRISGTQTLPLSPEHAYAAMQDPEILARAIPGCEALASLSGAFEGKVRIADQKPPSSFRLIVEGTGRIGFVKGDGLLRLSPADGGASGSQTEVTYEGDAQIGGTMAAVGQRLIDGTAKMMIKKFFEKLASEAAR